MPDDNIVDREEILPLLRGPTKQSGEWLLSYCPAHADGTKHNGKDGQSLGLSNKGVLMCYAGCDFKSIMDALRGGRPRDQGPVPIRNESERTMTRLYPYRAADGTLVAEKSRWETVGGSKSFLWRMPGSDRWQGLVGINQAQVPLYGSELLADRPDEPVYFVEGEKARDACLDRGLLAVCGPGGAAQRDFGESLEVLRNRDIRLWADNDAPGRSYMNLLAALVRSVATSVLWVNVPLGEKEDAHDYFRKGGKLASIETVDPSDPMLTVMAEDAVCILMPTSNGPVTWYFEEMEASTRALEANVRVATKESNKWPFEQRINMKSNSARTELRRELEGMYGKEYDWPTTINTAFALSRDFFYNQDRAVDLADIPSGFEEVLLVDPLVCAEGPTMFFGDGSSLKSYLIWKLIAHIALGHPMMGFRVPMLRTLVIDYEDSDKNFRRRMSRVCQGIDPNLDIDSLRGAIHYWDPKGMPLKDQVDALRRKIERDGIGLIVVDSAAPACGDDPSDSKATIALFTALKRLGLPTIIVAHVTKQGDTTKPFGSAFWHNESRRTWYVERVQEEDSDDLDIGLYCRKVNDGQRPSPFAFHVHFEGKHGPVTVVPGAIDDNDQLLARSSEKNQLWHHLEQPRTIAELVELTGIETRMLDRVLKRGPFARAGMRDSEAKGGRPSQLWARREERYEEEGKAIGDHWQ